MPDLFQMCVDIAQVQRRQPGLFAKFADAAFPESPSAAFYDGWNTPQLLSDEEAEDIALRFELDELVDAGYLEPEPVTAPDRWPELTLVQLADEHGVQDKDRG